MGYIRNMILFDLKHSQSTNFTTDSALTTQKAYLQIIMKMMISAISI